MRATKTERYRYLELESSNLLMERDGKWVLGRYTESALRSFQAGEMRVEMGQLSLDAGQETEAIEDWLSAAQCFLDARSFLPAQQRVLALSELERSIRFPVTRPDLPRHLVERRKDLQTLEQERTALLQAIGQGGYSLTQADPTTLAFLEKALDSLPGDALLHYAAFLQAELLGEEPRAARHLAWAAGFDPDNPNLPALQGYRAIAAGDLEEALRLGESFLSRGLVREGPVRLMLALALNARQQPGDAEHALELLAPLSQGATGRQRLAALLLTALVLKGRGPGSELNDLLPEMNGLRHAMPTAELQFAATELQQRILEGRDGVAALSEPERRRVVELLSRLGRDPEVLAA